MWATTPRFLPLCFCLRRDFAIWSGFEVGLPTTTLVILNSMATQPAREQLLRLIAKNAFRLGEFTLSSGLKSDYYVDCRTTTLHLQGAGLTDRVFLDLFRQNGWEPDAIGGLTMGADPIVVAVALLSAQDPAQKPI